MTHPKTFDDCHVAEDDVDVVDRGHAAFRTIYNEFIRVARDHRQRHGW